MNIKIILLIILVILCIIGLYKIQENFDETKIKTQEFATNSMKNYDQLKYQPYIDKYFAPIDIIDLRKIEVRNDNLIFCSIASYRDKECPLTVIDMINKAKYPQNLVICICQQNDVEDISCFDSYDLKQAKIIKINMISHDAYGPCWARYLIQQKWTGEQYFLQIDSHMRFVQDWDQTCINDLNMLPDKSCLTNYVSSYNLQTGIPDKDNQLRGPLKIVNHETSEFDGFFRVNSEFINTPQYKPVLAYGWSACFSFSKSDILHVASYDPFLKFLFFGEEMSIWARLYTHGWYVYNSSVICFTNFDRSYRPTFWQNPDQAHVEYLSRIRLYYLFGYLQDIPKELKINLNDYSLGLSKTWQEFLKFSLDEEKLNT